ncbi:MAG: GWxTD domain-containing protein [Candidatus Aminicenantes bacterium]|jgi:GWxTD domain-containing protein
MRKYGVIRILIIFSCIILFALCKSFQLEKSLNPEEKEFLSQVRFIITKEEKNIYLRLPESDRKAFVEEFWAKRDPDPLTEENEFKIEYYSRIESANRIFRGEGIPGWLTDRGRMYIIFGPPFSRKYYPPGSEVGIRRAREIWYYGNFPVIFEDTNSNGVFRLLTTNVAHLGEINYALREVTEDHRDQIEQYTNQRFILDFDVKLEESSDIPVILVKIPYRNIWFKEKTDEKILETNLSIDITILDVEEKTVFEHNQDYPVSLTEESLEDQWKDEFIIEIPVILATGKYSVQATLTNTTGNKTVSKKFQIRVK